MEYSLFFPQFSNLVITVLAFVLSLSIIVFIHEFGHYFVGKLSGIHAEVFSIGFGPVVLSKYDSKGTKWQIAAFPLGGYVKFLGDKNSASVPDPKIDFEDEESLLRNSIHGAPLWARFITVAAGPIFNFIFSGIIFFLIFMNQGTTRFPITVEKPFDAPYNQSFKEGDVIRSVNGVPVDNDLNEFVSFVGNFFSEEFLTYVVERDGRLLALNKVVQNPPRISQVLPKSSAITAGLKKGDFILSVNSEKISNFKQIKEAVEASEGDVLSIEYLRKGSVYRTDLKPLIVDVPTDTGGFDRVFRVGIVSDYFPFMPATTNQSISRSFINSIESIYLIMEGSIKGLYHILFGNISTCNLSGPISIAETSGQMVKQGSMNYLWFIAVLSTAIGMINLFPIPVLDGGHLMFFTVEAILGKKPNHNIVNTFMTIGFVLLVGLMLFSLFNDFLCP